MLHSWKTSLATLQNFPETAEVTHFIIWSNQFIKICREQNWLSEAIIPIRLITSLPHHLITWPKKIFLLGFDELPPSYQELIELLNLYTEVLEIDSEKPEGQCQSVSFQNFETELVTVAHWAKANWQAQPQQKIGCVVPQLTHHRNQITQIFNRFAIENQLPGVLHTILSYNISASKPLHHFSAIFIAMEILALGFKQ